MAETQTPNFHWIKPDIGGDASVWGNVLNTTIDAIDSVVFNNQQGLVPIGSINMFAGSTAPANWLLCQGQSLSTTGTYAALFAIIGYAYGGSGANFNLPNLQGKFPYGVTGAAAPGATGGEATHVLAATEIPAHTHPASQATHTHTITQTPHAHGITDLGHGHTITQNPHRHGGGAVSGSSAGGLGGQNFGLTGPANADITIDNNTTGISIVAINANISLDPLPAPPAVTVAANTGGGAAHNNLPPYLSINFIIRYV